jgi:hypothetical protein
MRLLPLTQGQEAQLDDADYLQAYSYKWYAQWSKSANTFYAVRKVRLPNGKRYTLSLHRAVMGLENTDAVEVDHIDHNGLNDQRYNLRVVSRSMNGHNRRNVKGCYKVKNGFRAMIMIQRKFYDLGTYPTEIEAHLAYLAAKASYIK